MKNLLFPRVFQTIGWLLFVPATIMGLLYFFSICDFSGILDRIVDFNGIWETIFYDSIIIGIALGGLFIVCSKELHEDEMTRSIRLSALLNSLYAYVMLLVISTLFINGMAYIKFMVLNLVLMPVIYVILFRLEMHRYNKMSEDEE